MQPSEALSQKAYILFYTKHSPPSAQNSNGLPMKTAIDSSDTHKSSLTNGNSKPKILNETLTNGEKINRPIVSNNFLNDVVTQQNKILLAKPAGLELNGKHTYEYSSKSTNLVNGNLLNGSIEDKLKLNEIKPKEDQTEKEIKSTDMAINGDETKPKPKLSCKKKLKNLIQKIKKLKISLKTTDENGKLYKKRTLRLKKFIKRKKILKKRLTSKSLKKQEANDSVKPAKLPVFSKLNADLKNPLSIDKSQSQSQQTVALDELKAEATTSSLRTWNNEESSLLVCAAKKTKLKREHNDDDDENMSVLDSDEYNEEFDKPVTWIKKHFVLILLLMIYFYVIKFILSKYATNNSNVYQKKEARTAFTTLRMT